EIGLEEIGEAHAIGERAQDPLRPLDRGRREVDREHVVARSGERAHLVSRAAAGDQDALAARLGVEEALQIRWNAARVPGREVLAEALLPELGLRRVLPNL